MATTLHTQVVLDALSMALWQRRAKDVIHHSDQGSQYTSIESGKRCREAGVRPSMGSVGDAYDNAMAESFFATLECELLDRRRFRTQAEARMAVFEFIEGFYNPRRRHSSLGYLSPVEFERQQEEGALDPGTHHPAAVLGAVKVRPGDVAMGGEVSATADLDRPCARRLHVRAGRDEKMLSAEPKDGLKATEGGHIAPKAATLMPNTHLSTKPGQVQVDVYESAVQSPTCKNEKFEPFPELTQPAGTPSPA